MSDKMKIAIIGDVLYPFSMGGSEIRNYEVSRRLAAAGHEVHMFGIKYWDGPDTLEQDGVKLRGISNIKRIYDANGKRRALTAIILSFRLFSVLVRERFDVLDVHTFIFTNCYVVKVISFLKGEPLIFTWHQYFGRYLFGYFGKAMGAVAFLLERFSVGLARKNIAVSDHVRNELVKRGVSRDRIAVIPSGGDIGSIRSVPQGNKEYELIFVGRLTYQKNLMLLVDTVRVLKKSVPNVRVCLVGDGDQSEALKRVVEEKGLKDCFEFIGRENDRSKVYEYMKRSKIFIFTSILEGLPLTAVEANACGLPIISVKTEWNDLSHFLEEDGRSGVVTEPDADSLSGAIEELLNNRGKMLELGNNGIKKAGKYDWDTIAERTESLYENECLPRKSV